MTIAIADAGRLPAMRVSLPLTGRVTWFPSNKLDAAFQSIQLNHPKLVIVDAEVAKTQSGTLLLERLQGLADRGCSVRLIVRTGAGWTTTAMEPHPSIDRSESSGVQRARSGVVVSMPSRTVASVVASTRRAPRFPVVQPIDALVDGGTDVTLVDLSLIGAQVLSGPMLRPNQKITISLPDPAQPVSLMAQVMWSTMQQTAQRPEAHFRVGLEFRDAADAVLKDYCQRYCGAAAALR